MIVYLPIIVPALLIVVAIALLMKRFLQGDQVATTKKKSRFKGKDRNAIVREANKRLSQNPKDPDALMALADLYFNEGSFDKSLRTYELLLDLCATNPDLDEFTITLRHAISAYKVKNHDSAYKSFVIARSMNSDIFEVNYHLGVLEFNRKNYEKAAALLSQARQAKPDHPQTLKYLGHSLFKMQRYKEALGLLRKAMDFEPDDKESLFAMAQSYNNLGQSDQAIKIFSHLRADPQVGPHAALFAGSIHLNHRNFPKAIMDFEIGLRHQGIRREIELELKYRLASAYVKQQELAKAITLFREIQQQSPDYRDVPQQLKQYAELNTNRNLQTYLMAPTSDFVTLCRKLAVSFYPQAKVKIIDISVQKNEFADIMAEVSTSKWEDLVLFRFVRTNGQIGELILRDLYSRIKESKAGRGYCLSAGAYTEGAVQFVEARLIDLIGKNELVKKLKDVDGRSA